MWTNTHSGRVPADGFQQVERADRVDVEVVERAGGGEVVARLGRGVDEHIRLQLVDQREHGRAVTNIELVMAECGLGALQPVLVPARVAGGPKKSARMLLSTPWISWP